MTEQKDLFLKKNTYFFEIIVILFIFAVIIV